MIHPTTIEAVKELSITDVIGKYVDLKKAGNNNTFRAPSPFTNEKTPSFYVVGNKGFFKCFSSGKGGDHITFVIEKFGIGYIDAIQKLCADFGIEVKYEENGHEPDYYDKLKLLHKINHAAANRYAGQLQQIFAWDLPEGGTAWYKTVYTELIERRKFTHDTIVQWQIGFAPGTDDDGYTPKEWRFLASTLVEKGYYDQGIALGLIKTKEGVTYDTFRSRIMYPIVDHHGKYVSFGGRTIKDHHGEHNAKYLNGGNSPIFDKSRVLYGLHYAADAIRKAGYVNLMEGYTDVISFHQAGITNTVGSCGTALTDEQCKLLKKYTNRAALFFDPDEPGQNAAMRSIDLLMQHGFLTSIVPLPTVITLKEGEGKPWTGPEAVFIRHREKDRVICRRGQEEIELPMTDIASAEKIDPDELVRMFV